MHSSLCCPGQKEATERERTQRTVLLTQKAIAGRQRAKMICLQTLQPGKTAVVQNFDNFFKMSNLSTLRVLIHDTLAMPKFGTCALSETCSVSVEVQHGTSPLHAQEKLWKGM